ncbi:hypothetical protein FRC07_001976, partial [Ceratobasidium sp. 392]
MNASLSGDRWAVGLAPRAVKELQKLKRDRIPLDIVWKKIKELSSAQFTPDNYTAFIGTVPNIPIYRARLSSDLRIIYFIDVVPDKAKAHKSSEYRDRCIYRPPPGSTKDNVILPSKFPHVAYGAETPPIRDNNEDEMLTAFGSDGYVAATKLLFETTTKDSDDDDDDDNDDEANMHEKEPSTHPKAFHPAGYTPLYSTKSANSPAARTCLPRSPEISGDLRSKFSEILRRSLEVSGDKSESPEIPGDLRRFDCQQQYEIVNHRGTTIVVGRSGTGKTTALVYKMESINRLATKPIRQLFVTRSPVLAKHVQSTFNRLVCSIDMQLEGTEEPDETWKILDQSVAQFDSEVELRKDLPSSFSELNKSHFPLFISFGKLCSLIEADIGDRQQKKKFIWSAKPIWQHRLIDYKYNFLSSVQRKTYLNTPLTSREFKEIYWPKFKTIDRSGLNPFLVYSEVLGVIKGYSEVMGCPHGYLSRDQYALGNVAHKVSAHLDVTVKTRIYSIFEDYKKLQRARFEIDQADRSHHIIEFFTLTVPDEGLKFGDFLPSIDFLYVDEVQDNLMSDIFLLCELCKNIENTYWGGDTAQTILAGSAFRITDLRSYLYEELYDSTGRKLRRLPSKLTPSKFELAVNYRSQEGIVRCASSIVDILYDLFPESLDHLPGETANDPSIQSIPIVLSDTSSEDSAFVHFLLNSTFGAQQAILVRSEELEKHLKSQISTFCPILTIAKSKGLEFDDIVLYNFFADSECPTDWGFVDGSSAKTYRNAPDLAPPLSLCAELKLLYVAITRARQRCWVWDRGYAIEAMKRYWLKKQRVETMSSSNITYWGNTSSSAEWIQKGQEYFANKLYRLAAECFGQAGSEADTNRRIAIAYDDMSKAKLEMRQSDTWDNRKKLRDAATALGNCATLVHGESARHLWFHQAECLELAHVIPDSADTFVRAEQYERAIRALLEFNYFKQTAKILREHGHNLEPGVRDDVLDRCRRHFFESCDYRELLPLFNHNLDDELAFACKNAFREQLKYLLGYYERYDELAQVHLEDKELDEGLISLLKAFEYHGNVTSLDEGASVVVSYAEWIFTLESAPSQPALELFKVMTGRVLSYEGLLEPKRRKAITQPQLALFRNILSKQLTLKTLDDWSQANFEEMPAKALALHNILQDMSRLSSCDVSNTLPTLLKAWEDYNTILSKIIDAMEPSKLADARRLFGFKPSSPSLYVTSHYIVAEDSWIAQCAPRNSSAVQRNSRQEFLILASWIDKTIKGELRRYLNDRLRKIYSELNFSGRTSLY